MRVDCAGCGKPMGDITHAKLRKGWKVVCSECATKLVSEGAALFEKLFGGGR